jgi:uncharacterized membrane protein YphA (DoxX/SURF4 family)
MGALMLLPLRLFLALGWSRAALEKVIDPSWWDGQKLRDFLIVQDDDALAFFRPVMDHVLTPLAVPVAVAVAVLQIACGVCIGLGRWMCPALLCGVLMNTAFILAGRTNPSIFYLLIQGVLIFGILEGVVGPRRRWSSGWTAIGAAASFLGAFALVPFVSTLEPSMMVNDPALVLIMILGITGTVLIVHAALTVPASVTHFRSQRRMLERWARADHGPVAVAVGPMRHARLERRSAPPPGIDPPGTFPPPDWNRRAHSSPTVSRRPLPEAPGPLSLGSPLPPPLPSRR